MVRTVGADYPNPPAVGARVASLASLTLTPLRLEELGAVDAKSNSIAARGTAFLFQSAPWALLPTDVPESVMIAALDVAGAPARVRARTRPASRVLIVGGGHSGSLAAIAAAEAGAAEVLVADIDPERLAAIEALGLKTLRTVRADATDAVAFADAIGVPVDLCVSCVDRPGVEPACILATQRARARVVLQHGDGFRARSAERRGHGLCGDARDRQWAVSWARGSGGGFAAPSPRALEHARA